ncbi:MAG: hypothetical protein GY820_35885 [Gammaproteobacteria bacterium]|nr:hypothetical protein [Gammaproteobacteria bacterium]
MCSWLDYGRAKSALIWREFSRCAISDPVLGGAPTEEEGEEEGAEGRARDVGVVTCYSVRSAGWLTKWCVCFWRLGWFYKLVGWS